MTASLLVIVPTRGRRAQVERLLDSYDKNTDFAEITFVLDPDDQETYEGIDWKDSLHAVLDPRGTLVQKLNSTAEAVWDDYDALMYCGDDHTFDTDGWDTILMNALEEMGGSGMVYPDDKRRNDVPEIIVISADIIRALGHFADPGFNHYYIDNAWLELGGRTSLIRYVPEAVVAHHHYSVDQETKRDETYSYAEQAWGQADYQAFQQWRGSTMPAQVSLIRRKFNPDVKWVLGKF